MEITVANYAGFCFGVERAISTVHQLIDKNRIVHSHIYTLGNLIHNPHVIRQLQQNGVTAIAKENLPALLQSDEDTTVVIRTHGIPKAISDMLLRAAEKNPLFHVIDCTCPYVKKIHEIAARESQIPNRFAIIIGDKNHPEVQGIMSYFQCETFVFSSSGELENAINALPKNKMPILVAQTTQNLSDYKKCQKIIENLYTNAAIFDTICKVTENRQIEVKELSSKMDAMIIIGGKESSNSKKLYEVSKQNCFNSYYIEDLQDLDLSDFSPNTKVGIAAGASTPGSIIEEVKKTMSEINNNEENFAQMLEESFKTLNTGDIVKGIITSITPTEIHVDIGAKVTGILSHNDFSNDPSASFEDSYKVGDEIEAIAVRVNDIDGIATLSKKKIDASKNWEKIVEAEKEQTVIDAKVIEAVKGGVIALALGAKVFIPASQTMLSKDSDLSVLIGKTVKVKIISINEQRKRAVASERIVAREEKAAKEAEFWANAEVGQKIENALVKSLTSYGAFVDIGGVDGLLHSSELSWRHIKHPSEVVNVGDRINVFIKALDPENKRIALGYKTEESNPWTIFTNQYNVGDTASVKIINMMPFGAFAEIVPGVDGLIHISQISKEKIANPADVLKKDQIVDAKIINIDNDAKKVSLSIRALLEDNDDAADSADESEAADAEADAQ